MTGNVDFTSLLPAQRCLVVEGKQDVKFIEAALTAGERVGHWDSWRSKIVVQSAGGIEEVWKQLDGLKTDVALQSRIFGLVDRDWRATSEINASIEKYQPQLLVLPRIHIDNYYVDPDEIHEMLPSQHREQFLVSIHEIEQALPAWIKQGAIAKTLFESGAEEFCGRGGFKLLRRVPIPNDDDILAYLQRIHTAIEPQGIFQRYQQYLGEFNTSATKYHHCVSGKLFFSEVILPVLKKLEHGMDKDNWCEKLRTNLPNCPADLVPLLKMLLA